LYLKIKIKKKRKEVSNNFLLFMNESEFKETDSLKKRPSDVTIEGIFLDITQSYLKKESLVNSSFFSKYIADIKISLCLFDQILKVNEIKNPNDKTRSRSINKNETSEEIFLIENKFMSKKILVNQKYRRIVYDNLIDSVEAVEKLSKKEINNNLIKQKSNSKLNHVTFEKEKVNLRKLIHSSIDFYRIYSKLNPSKKTVKLLAEIDPDIPHYINSNQLSIKQVIMNLLSNALKFTYHGEVKLICRLKTKLELEQTVCIEIAVIDSGVGIEHDDLIRLCKPFGFRTFRQDSILGLDIVREILQEIDSKLIINSVRNRGSSFSFILQVDVSNCFRELELDIYSPKYSDCNSSNIGINPSFQNGESETILEQSNNNNNSLKNIKEENCEDFTVVYDRPFQKIGAGDFAYFPEKEESSSCFDFELNLELNSPISELNRYIPRENKKTYYNDSNKKNKHKNYIDDETNLDKPLIDNEEIYRPTNHLNNNQVSTAKKLINVLVVCDDKNYHVEIMERMQNVSCEIENINIIICPTCCLNPIEAINIIYQSCLTKKYFDLVLCEENTPFMKGADFAKLYKTTLAQNGLYPIIFSSLRNIINIASDKESFPQNELFFDFFLNKNFKNQEITIIIKEIDKKNKK